MEPSSPGDIHDNVHVEWVHDTTLSDTMVDGGVVSGNGVVTETAADAPDMLPAASCAVTVYEYVVPAVTVASAYVLPAVEPITAPPLDSV